MAVVAGTVEPLSVTSNDPMLRLRAKMFVPLRNNQFRCRLFRLIWQGGAFDAVCHTGRGMLIGRVTDAVTSDALGAPGHPLATFRRHALIPNVCRNSAKLFAEMSREPLDQGLHAYRR